MSSPSTLSSAGNGNGQNFETYSKILQLKIQASLDHSANSTNSSSSVFGRTNLNLNSGPNNRSSPPSITSSTNSTITNVRVTVTYPNSTSITSSANRQIRLCLTNDSDPLFYFYLLITEQDYPALKQNQGLLVDFINFPSQLISLLEKCGDTKFGLELKYSHGQNSGSSRDLTNNAVLDIVEPNPFKYLSHLSLVINPGSDAEVKRYLSELAVQLKEENEALRTKFQHLHSSLESELAKGKYELERKTEEIIQLREEMYKDSTHSLEKYMRELTLEKEKFSQFQNELIRKSNQEKTEIEEKYKEVISLLENKNTAAENDKTKLENNLRTAETQLKDAEGKLKTANSDISLLNQELQKVRKNNAKLDSDYHEKQRVVNSLISKVTSFETELKEKSSHISKQQEHISSLVDKCRHCEEKYTETLRESDSMRSQLKSISSDLTKANQIIRKMQDEGRHMGKQLKILSGQLQEKERELLEKRNNLEETTKRLNEMTNNFETNAKDLAECRKENEELTKTVTTQVKILSANENTINWLNTRLNQNHGFGNVNHLNQFRQAIGEPSSIQSIVRLNQTAPLPSTRSPHFLGHLLDVSENNPPISTVPTCMTLYNNNTGRSNAGLTGNSGSQQQATFNNTATTRDSEYLNQDSATGQNGNVNGANESAKENATVRPSTRGAATKPVRTPTWAKPNKKVTLGPGANTNWRH